MSIDAVYIPTRGRVGAQKTLRALSTDLKKNHLTMVVPKMDYKAHKLEPYFKETNWLVVPNELMLTEKRFHIMRHHVEAGGDRMIFMDDDLLFQMWIKEENSIISVLKHKLQDRFSDRLMKWSDTALNEHGCWSFAHSGIPTRMALLKEGLRFKLNQKCCNVFAYSAKDLLETTDHPQFMDLWGIDTIWNLETMVQGKSTYLEYRLLMDAGFQKPVPGGAAPLRTTDKVHQSFLKMMLLHPGLIKRGKQGHHVHSFLRIDWRGALKLRDQNTRDLMYGKGWHLFYDELMFQQLTPTEFLEGVTDYEARNWFRARMKEMYLMRRLYKKKA